MSKYNQACLWAVSVEEDESNIYLEVFWSSVLFHLQFLSSLQSWLQSVDLIINSSRVESQIFSSQGWIRSGTSTLDSSLNIYIALLVSVSGWIRCCKRFVFTGMFPFAGCEDPYHLSLGSLTSYTDCESIQENIFLSALYSLQWDSCPLIEQASCFEWGQSFFCNSKITIPFM
jgi:hypothetical protein